MLAVCDTETSGLDHLKDQICEIAGVFLHPDATHLGSFAHSLCSISCEIHPAAQATHHIDSKDLEGKPHVNDWLRKHWPTDVSFIVAHNAPFDRGFMAPRLDDCGLRNEPWIDTYRCARHLWPDAPAYGNQTLRYWLKLNVDGLIPPGLYAHRALYDALVTTRLFQKMLESKTIHELHALTNTPVLLQKISFGKHFGTAWKDVPYDYLTWMKRESAKKPGSFDEDTMHTVNHWLSQ